jgi:hypothetical protein
MHTCPFEDLQRGRARSSSRRSCLQRLAVALAGAGLGAAWAQETSAPTALREMQIHRVRELGLVIWTENQPPWEVALRRDSGRPSFVAESPALYHPPSAIAYSSWPDERVAPALVQTLARTAIRQAAQNFGLNAARARTVAVAPARHGVLQGFEANFVGHVQGVAMDVKLFVGQEAGRFPVVCSAYTLQDKMAHLAQVIRRGWGQVSYLAG